jgi:hypothetical protein
MAFIVFAIFSFLCLLFFAAYKIKAESFEFSTAIYKLLEIKIKIKSHEKLGKDPDTQAGQEEFSV